MITCLTGQERHVAEWLSDSYKIQSRYHGMTVFSADDRARRWRPIGELFTMPVFAWKSLLSLFSCNRKSLSSRIQLACLCALWAFTSNAYAASMQGKPVGEVLSELRAQGLVFIYNTSLLGDELRIKDEPRAVDGVALAREILAPYGLSLLTMAPNVFAVVKQPQDTRPEPDNGATTSNTKLSTPLAEVIVQTSRYDLASDTPGSYAILTQKQVNDLPRFGGETLSAVQRLPGVASNGWSSLGPIRGGALNETGIVLDGMRLYEPFHLKNFLSPISVLDPRLIDSVEINSGGFSAQFGDRMSAIIDTHTIHPGDARYYELGLSVFHVNGLASIAFAGGDAHLLITARRSTASDLAHLHLYDMGEPSYSDGFVRLDYAPSENTRFSINALLSRDKVVGGSASIANESNSEAEDSGETEAGAGTESENEDVVPPARVDYRNNYLWLTVAHDWSERSATTMLIGYTDITNDRYGNVANSNLRNGTVTDLRNFQVANARIDHDWRGTWFGRSVQERFGVEARELTADYQYRSDITFAQNYPFPGWPEFEKHRNIALAPQCDEFSGYWDARIELGAKWAAQTGIRYDYQQAYETSSVSEWSPRASLLFAPLSTLKLRASWGRYVQSQAINELQVEDGVDQFYPPQSANHFIVSAEQIFGNGWRGRIEAYRKEYRHLQARFENLLDPLSLLPEMEFDRTAIAPTSARADGVEMLITSRYQGAWNGWFGYTWSRVTDRVDGKDVPRSWDQTHALNAGIIWTRGAWSIALTDLFHTGWPTTEVLVQSAATTGGATAKVIVGERNGARLSDFNSLDLRIKRSFVVARGYLDVYVEAANLLGKNNACCTTYSATRDSSGAISLRRTVTDWLGITPSAGLLWRY